MVPGGAEKKVWTVRRKKDEKRVTVHGAEKPGPEDHPGSGERDEPDAGGSSFRVAAKRKWWICSSRKKRHRRN